MKATDLIPVVPTFDIIDSTKVQEFMECPRKYFYNYVLGWKSENPNLHLEFGSAWHLAMEQIIIGGYGAENVSLAWSLLDAHYRQFFSAEMDSVNHPKEPGNALYALAGYANEYKERDANDKPLYTEIAGVASISADRIVYFKMDSILEVPDKGILSREHKTGSQLSRQWRDQWGVSIQTGTYNHVLHCLFPEGSVWGVEVNGTIFNKTKTQYERVPCRRTKPMMEVWLTEINYWCDNIEREMNFLFNECTDDDNVLRSFPRNTTSCTKYFGCQWIDYCLGWANPLRYCQQPPMGYKVEHWNPAAEPHKHYFKV